MIKEYIVLFVRILSLIALNIFTLAAVHSNLPRTKIGALMSYVQLVQTFIYSMIYS